MGKNVHQKLKIVYVRKMLEELSNEDHPVTVAAMVEELKKRGIPAERKSVYDDIDSLKLFGLDIQHISGRNGGYYIANRDFELPELKLLVDSVQSSKFITKNKTMSLIKKIEGLTNVHDAQTLHRQVYVSDRIKSMNESVYYNVDEISSAITQDKMIRFRYFEYTVHKEFRYRHNGACYEVSPFALMWDHENYYMVAWDAAASQMKHYRVDRMKQIDMLPTERSGKEHFQAPDMAAYSKKVFGMFTGREQTVRLRFAERLVGPVIDRFGYDVMLVPDRDGTFTVSVKVAVSPQFFAWIFAFGGEAEILSPSDVRDEMRAQLEALTARYKTTSPTGG